jgi:hypothetical protein
MSDNNTLMLHPLQHDKIGIIHCGVTRDGFVVVAGDTHDIADDQELTFKRAHIKVMRHGDDYTFARAA